jgi:putative membrane protein
VHSHAGDGVGFLNVLLVAGAGFVALSYLVSAVRIRARRPWPLYRSVLWVAGTLSVLAAAIGPIAAASHNSFGAHMVQHLLLGMLAPLLLVLAAPVTLALRCLDVVPARRLSAILRTPVVRFFGHPITAATLNIGGMWLIYPTDVFPAIHENGILSLGVHAHFLIAGYLFTASIIGVDPSPHRPGYRYRAVVLIVAMAGHGILAKFLFGHPPTGVPASQAEVGSMIMYYGGDLIHLVVITTLWSRWLAGARKRLASAGEWRHHRLDATDR